MANVRPRPQIPAVVVACFAAGLAWFGANPAGRASPTAPAGAKATLAVSARPARDATFRTGEAFSYWLELKNVSPQAVAVKSNLSITFSYSQGDLGGGAGNMHWAPCRSETYLIAPGETLTRLESITSENPKPGPAVLEFHVLVRAANADGTCAKEEHDLNATIPVTVLTPKRGSKSAEKK